MGAIHVVKTKGGLYPIYESDQDAMQKIADGEIIEISWKQARNWRNHKRYFAMLKMTIDNLPDEFPDNYRNIEFLRYEIMIGIGHCEFRSSIGGNIYPVAKSMSFSKMDEQEFQEIFKLSQNYILRHFLKDIDEETFNNNLNLFL